MQSIALGSMMSVSLSPTTGISHGTKRPYSFIANSVSSIISRLEAHSRVLNSPASTDESSFKVVAELQCHEMVALRRSLSQPLQPSNSLHGMEIYTLSEKTRDYVFQESLQRRNSMSKSSTPASSGIESRSSLCSAFGPNRLSDWEPPAEWLHDTCTTNSMSSVFDPTHHRETNRPAVPLSTTTIPSHLLAYRTVRGTAQPLLPELFTLAPAVNAQMTSMKKGKRAYSKHKREIHGLPTPPESPASGSRNTQFDYIDARWTDVGLQQPITSQSLLESSSEAVDFPSNLPSTSRPFIRLQSGPRHDVSRAYSDREVDRIVTAGTVEIQEWKAKRTVESGEDILSSRVYESLLDDYRRLAQPRMSVFENHDDKEQDKSTPKDTRLTPLPLFWSRAASKTRPLNVSEASLPDRASNRALRDRNFPHKRTAATLVGNNKHLTSLTAQRANGRLVISAPMPLNETAYIAAVSDQALARTAEVDGAGSTCVNDRENTKRPWHHRLSPRNLVSTMGNKRHSMHKITLPAARCSATYQPGRVRSRSSSPAESGSDADSWLPALDDEEPGIISAQNRNMKLLFHKMKWKSQAKERRKRNEDLRNAIQHVSVEQARKVESIFGESSGRKM